ncbi:hypothetical protein CDL12_01002 [Handroanthus impetiginosus]|uniref:O-methyltransferase C-terminal domain-containing protein n=1 Tax=Handroanthus impetiginosus TaxID=429701 RepID=A0A2G9I923_9LAMI|nr:hypothetical protein CDL12_01002 [Handroanthus impetiginosus]
MSTAPLALALLYPIMMDPWHHVSEWFQNESPSPFDTKHGMSFWEYASTEQMLNQLFNDAMARDAWFYSSLAIKECKHVFEWIPHDWSDEECVKLLEKCKESIIPSKGKGGKVIIAEMVVADNKEDHKATKTQLFFDMLMMVDHNGKERTEKEWAKLFSTTGFTNYKITTSLGLRYVTTRI